MIVPQIHQLMQINNYLTINFNHAKHFSLYALIGSSSSSDLSKVSPGCGASILSIIATKQSKSTNFNHNLTSRHKFIATKKNNVIAESIVGGVRYVLLPRPLLRHDVTTINSRILPLSSAWMWWCLLRRIRCIMELRKSNLILWMKHSSQLHTVLK
jgi:hypothetical protein